MKKAKAGYNNDEQQLMPVPGTLTYNGQIYDILIHALIGRFTAAVSPASLGLAFTNWMIHLAISPAKQADIIINTWRDVTRQVYSVINSYLGVSALPYEEDYTKDPRFKYEAWRQFPYSTIVQNFKLSERYWNRMTSNIRGVKKHHMHVVNFMMRQMLDLMSPSNYVFTNPEIIEKTISTGGINFIKGFKNYYEDYGRALFDLPPVGSEKFQLGVNLATAPGKVVFRNELIELIQYTPTTAKVYSEPILIVPAWIMKYYILDLSPHNSLVKYLVNKGHTVFMISWHNPTSEDRDLRFNSYLNLGVMAALDVINSIVRAKKVHAVGYCLGGTLLMIAAAAMAANNDDRLKSISLFAAQVDFRDAGELQLFVDESQITFLEDSMWQQGYLDEKKMTQTFNMLQSTNLIWSRIIHNYLLGMRRPMTDLMVWNADTTRMPYKMHSEYLRNLFLNNDLSQGHFVVNKKRILLRNINVPIFAVATEKDHISPWKSVYKLYHFTKSPITFVLTSGGHNAGIVSEPGHKGRTYKMMLHQKGEMHSSPEIWYETASQYKGSWWPAWEKWLVKLSAAKTKPPKIGNPNEVDNILCDAPGTYVFEK